MRFAFLFLFLGLFAFVPNIAHACKCTHPALSSVVGKADAVFTGEVTAVREVKSGSTFSYEIDISVTEIWKGEIGATTVVATSASSCGLKTYGAKPGVTLLFVATKNTDGVLGARQCNGTRSATKKARAEATRLLGTPKAP